MSPALGELEIEVMHDTHTKHFGQYWMTSQVTPETLFISLLVTSLNISPRQQQDSIQDPETILFSHTKSSNICCFQSSEQSHISSGHEIIGSVSHEYTLSNCTGVNRLSLPF